jgi:hypothetical protein
MASSDEKMVKKLDWSCGVLLESIYVFLSKIVFMKLMCQLMLVNELTVCGASIAASPCVFCDFGDHITYRDGCFVNNSSTMQCRKILSCLSPLKFPR